MWEFPFQMSQLGKMYLTTSITKSSHHDIKEALYWIKDNGVSGSLKPMLFTLNRFRQLRLEQQQQQQACYLKTSPIVYNETFIFQVRLKWY